MIAELRQRHRWNWVVLLVVLPAVLFVAWRMRRGPDERMAQIPAVLREGTMP